MHRLALEEKLKISTDNNFRKHIAALDLTTKTRAFAKVNLYFSTLKFILSDTVQEKKLFLVKQ